MKTCKYKEITGCIPNKDRCVEEVGYIGGCNDCQYFSGNMVSDKEENDDIKIEISPLTKKI